MRPKELLTTLEREGLRLGLDDTGGLRCFGDRAKIDAYLPTIREHKAELLRLLTGKPAPAPLPVPWDAIRDRIQAGWRAEFSPPDETGHQAIRWTPPGEWTPEPLAPPPEQCPHHGHPLTDAELASLVTEVACAHGVEPLAVWRWLPTEDIEALRSGDPDEARAFRAAVASACAGGRLVPDGGHTLPFPEDELLTHPERYEVVTFDRWRLSSGREVSFRLAFPKDRYDPFELLKLLGSREGEA